MFYNTLKYFQVLIIIAYLHLQTKTIAMKARVIIITKYNLIRKVIKLYDDFLQDQMIRELAAMKELDFINAVKDLMFPELKAMGSKRYTIQ